MTIAWFRLFTVLPLRPVLRIPSLRSCIAFSTFFFAPLEYFLATIVHLRFSIDSHPVNALCISRLHDRPLAWVENQQLRHPSVSGSGVVVALTVTSGTSIAPGGGLASCAPSGVAARQTKHGGASSNNGTGRLKKWATIREPRLAAAKSG
jgi:hypothetical protein